MKQTLMSSEKPLDLIHVPAQSVWVEWPDRPRQEALKVIPALQVNPCESARHGGALITASPGCRSGCIRVFWSTSHEVALLSPLVIMFDFDHSPPIKNSEDPGLWRGETVLSLAGEPAVEELLAHLRFHFDDEWAAYYSARCHSAEMRAAVLHHSLGGCAFDAPMLMAFFLLLAARDLLPRQEVSHLRINRIRRQAGKAPLLEHIEVSAPLDRGPLRGGTSPQDPVRSSPRLHHVRGHLVRRGSAVYWRSPHLRGNSRLGEVRSRTVVLSFAQASVEASRAYH